MRLESGPACRATSFLGPGSATCTAMHWGTSLKVVVTVEYPFGLNLISGQPATSSFRIDPGGGYNSLN